MIACHHDVASIGGIPINEFTTKGYFSCAFPTLFPICAGDFSGQRQNQVTIGNYFKHLMMYDDNCFAKHSRFRFFALNTEMRWRALQTGRVYIKQHPGDAQLSLDELRDMHGQKRGTDLIQSCVHSIREYQDFPNSYLLFTKVIGASVSESHLGSSTRPLSVCLSVCLYIFYVRHFWSRGPRATRKRKPAHLKFKGHMHACCIVANASRVITTLIDVYTCTAALR